MGYLLFLVLRKTMQLYYIRYKCKYSYGLFNIWFLSFFCGKIAFTV